jgi:hypothetical protein
VLVSFLLGDFALALLAFHHFHHPPNQKGARPESDALIIQLFNCYHCTNMGISGFLVANRVKSIS